MDTDGNGGHTGAGRRGDGANNTGAGAPFFIYLKYFSNEERNED